MADALFIVAGLAAVGAWIYGALHFLQVWWALLRQRRPERKHITGSLLGLSLFAAMVGVIFAAGARLD